MGRRKQIQSCLAGTVQVTLSNRNAESLCQLPWMDLVAAIETQLSRHEAFVYAARTTCASRYVAAQDHPMDATVALRAG